MPGTTRTPAWSGNLVFVSRLRREGHDPAAIRLALLAHHYRSDWEWTAAGLAEAERRLAAWRSAVLAPVAAPASPVLDDVRRSLADDLDAPSALAAVDRWAEATRLRGGGPGHEDAAAGRLVADVVDALLGVSLG
jgi:L-cysteine:1D-myo-inositol 2-amino-2-deoxy-alpha-D-glucopyranoside ligase